MAVRYAKNTQRNFCRLKLFNLVTVLEGMTMGGLNQNNNQINHKLVMGDYVSLCVAGIVVMFIVWITLKLPEVRQTQTNKYCYYHCLAETDKKMEGRPTSGPFYMDSLSKCYKACIEEENKEKNEKDTNKDDRH